MDKKYAKHKHTYAGITTKVIFILLGVAIMIVHTDTNQQNDKYGNENTECVTMTNKKEDSLYYQRKECTVKKNKKGNSLNHFRKECLKRNEYKLHCWWKEYTERNEDILYHCWKEFTESTKGSLHCRLKECTETNKRRTHNTFVEELYKEDQKKSTTRFTGGRCVQTGPTQKLAACIFSVKNVQKGPTNRTVCITRGKIIRKDQQKKRTTCIIGEMKVQKVQNGQTKREQSLLVKGRYRKDNKKDKMNNIISMNLRKEGGDKPKYKTKVNGKEQTDIKDYKIEDTEGEDKQDHEKESNRKEHTYKKDHKKEANDLDNTQIGLQMEGNRKEGIIEKVQKQNPKKKHEWTKKGQEKEWTTEKNKKGMKLKYNATGKKI